jgi:CRP/FNR family transcriptional regulator, cyclic AMP receptor protein
MLESILAAAQELPEVTYPDGATVLVEGQNPAPLLVLISGTVQMSRADVPISVVSQPGAVFGEIAALLGVPATATVRTRGESVFRICDHDQFAFLASHPEISLAVAQLLARRVDALTSYLVDVRHQYADRDDHLGVMDVVLESLSHHHGSDFEPGSDRETEAPY